MTWCSRGVGNWVAKYKKEHGSAEEREAAAEAVEVARLKKQVRELQQENEFLKKAAAFFAKEQQ
ncbi:transposase [Actinomyces bowdenii]|uniref:Transposase n=1 Tax=Actinomyces bowdenii TaxID=131109 RepID=A0A853EHJ7_9ACTO|nr:transposase [Actinomyces bowdenii]MBF0695972.1 transposase [Actinomyces bowdenii]NYS68145.1 transposase [Actinomyces bowdenii]